MKIGDILPLPDDVDRSLVRIAMARRRTSASLDSIVTTNQAIGAAKKAIRDAQARRELMNDPVEQAKHWLRCKGYSPVYTDKGQHYVGRRVLADSAALFEFAARKGWGRATP